MSDQITFCPSWVTNLTSILLVLVGAYKVLTFAWGKASSNAFLSLTAGSLYPQLLQYYIMMLCDMLKFYNHFLAKTAFMLLELETKKV